MHSTACCEGIFRSQPGRHGSQPGRSSASKRSPPHRVGATEFNVVAYAARSGGRCRRVVAARSDCGPGGRGLTPVTEPGRRCGPGRCHPPGPRGSRGGLGQRRIASAPMGRRAVRRRLSCLGCQLGRSLVCWIAGAYLRCRPVGQSAGRCSRGQLPGQCYRVWIASGADADRFRTTGPAGSAPPSLLSWVSAGPHAGVLDRRSLLTVQTQSPVGWAMQSGTAAGSVLPRVERQRG